MVSIGNKLKALRSAFGLSQQEFADKLDITKGRLNTYENDKVPTSWNLQWTISEITGIGMDYFSSDMNIEEALAKYNVKPQKSSLKATTCLVYDGLKEFAQSKLQKIKFIAKDESQENKNESIKSIATNSYMLNLIFMDEAGKCVVRVKGQEAEPFASAGDILCVDSKNIANTQIANKDIVICATNDTNDIFLFQYCIGGENLKETYLVTYDLKSKTRQEAKINDSDKICILGIVRTKITKIFI